MMGQGEEERKYDVGIAILKIIACYVVVCCHFGGFRSDAAVPAFMLLAFYLSPKSLFTKGGGSLRKRIFRLLVPFWFWGVVGLFVWPFTTSQSYTMLSLAQKLIAQLTLGSPLNSPLYFMSILVLFTALFHFIGYRGENRDKCKIIIIAASALMLQYTGLNYGLCRKFPMGSGVVIGRISELLPYAVMGLLLNTVVSRGNCKTSLALFLGGGGVIVSEFPDQPLGFGYQGFALFFESSVIAIAFIGLGRALPRISRYNVLQMLAGCTGAIYYMHRLVGDALIKLFAFPSGALFSTVVFVVSLVLAAAMRRVPILSRVAQ